MGSTRTKTVKATKAAKAERRARRGGRGSKAGRDRWPVSDPATIERLLEGFRSFDPHAPWATNAPKVVPLLRRVRAPMTPDGGPAYVWAPPGLWTGFGVDLGPAWAHVSQTLIDGWGIDMTTLLGTALDNLRRRVVDEPPVIDVADVDGVPITCVQAQGWGSALILAPDRLRDLIGPEPRLLLAPVRNALVALPEDVDVDMAVLVWEIFADQCPDELDIDPLHWTGSDVVRLDGPDVQAEPVH